MNDETSLFDTIDQLRFYVSPPHPCSYLETREAITLFVDPEARMDMTTYEHLSGAGFRRSGNFVYRPHCGHCHSCVPVRLPVAGFQANRSQRRCWNKNRDLRLTIKPAGYEEEHYQLYRQYMQSRHPGGGMDKDDPEAYRRVMMAAWSDTRLFEFRRGDQLLAVAIVDSAENSLSAVYTFFAPHEPNRSLGVYAVLSQIEHARQAGLDWLYLGYWNPDTPKMAYKEAYQPLQYFDGKTWRDHSPLD